MLGLGINDVVIFFVTIGVCLAFVIIWIIKAESRRNIFKDAMAKLKARVDAAERDKFMLSEKIESLEKNPAPISPGPVDTKKVGKDSIGLKQNALLLMQALKQNEELEKENKKLKLEVDEAKVSLEDIYKALVEKKS